MLRAVIFDFDGVITDSEILHFRAFNRVLARFSVEITMRDYYKTYLGLTDVDCFNLLISEGQLKTTRDKIEDLLKQKNEVFQELAKTEGRIIEGVHDFLKMLSQNNIPMAICSGALRPEIELILEEARLRHFFEVIISAEQVKKGKPSPDGFLLTLRKFNKGRQAPITGIQCVVIEDSHWGLQAAKAAGMHTIAVTNSYDARQLALAEKIVTRLSDLTMNDLQLLCT
jgi:HAD superfamily hydrolase (TIGR01509 family)